MEQKGRNTKFNLLSFEPSEKAYRRWDGTTMGEELPHIIRPCVSFVITPCVRITMFISEM
ncbi:MAG: hypothetical protein DRP62_07810 [Planctomycetota bacterium]|nr:MAG: hypothetical protein DRP62_07810 [Planctomycetota bacterium]